MPGRRRFWLLFLGVAWAIARSASIAVFRVVEPTGDSFLRGWNRILIFPGWQGLAAAIAVGVSGAGRGWPRGSMIRHLSRFPAGLAALLVAVVGGLLYRTRA